MKTFACGCSLTRESWQLCREHFDAKEGRLDAYWDELERLERLNDELLTVCKAAHSALRSYQYGNGSPELAEEIADKLWPVIVSGERAAIATAEGESK